MFLSKTVEWLIPLQANSARSAAARFRPLPRQAQRQVRSPSQEVLPLRLLHSTATRPPAAKPSRAWSAGIFTFFLPRLNRRRYSQPPLALRNPQIRRPPRRPRPRDHEVLCWAISGLAGSSHHDRRHAIAIPNLLRARMAANKEATAVGSHRTINTAVLTYATEFENGFPVRSLRAAGLEARRACNLQPRVSARYCADVRPQIRLRFSHTLPQYPGAAHRPGHFRPKPRRRAATSGERFRLHSHCGSHSARRRLGSTEQFLYRSKWTHSGFRRQTANPPPLIVRRSSSQNFTGQFGRYIPDSADFACCINCASIKKEAYESTKSFLWVVALATTSGAKAASSRWKLISRCCSCRRKSLVPEEIVLNTAQRQARDAADNAPHPLDNPIWNSLSTLHAHFRRRRRTREALSARSNSANARGHGRTDERCVCVARENFAARRRSISGPAAANPRRMDHRPRIAKLVQMVCEKPNLAQDGFPAEKLTPADVPEMVALAELTTSQGRSARAPVNWANTWESVNPSVWWRWPAKGCIYPATPKSARFALIRIFRATDMRAS